MRIFDVPEWVKEANFPYARPDEVPSEIFEQTNSLLDKKISKAPLVSILISAYNEEVNVLRCIASLALTNTTLPFEIIVTNNNSTDRTQETLDKLHVKTVFQEIQGWGPARQKGQENAKGKYILLADADCLYPPHWVDEMMKVLRQKDVVCVYGRYSFIPEPGFPRWKLFFLEQMKNVAAELRHLKRPYLNTYGISMGYVAEYGLRIGFVMEKIRGEDGRLAFDLMNYGKIKQVKSAEAMVWTGPRTLGQDGSFNRALVKRLSKELKRMFTLFKSKQAHDTKTSTND